MKGKILIILMLIVLLPSSFALELGSQKFPNSTNQEFILSNLPEPGILPDSPFYFVKEIKENFQLLITFDQNRKNELEKHFAEIRLAEANKLLEKNRDTKSMNIFKEKLSDYNKITKNEKLNSDIVDKILENKEKPKKEINEEVKIINKEINEKKEEIKTIIDKTDKIIKYKKEENNSLDIVNKTVDLKDKQKKISRQV